MSNYDSNNREISSGVNLLISILIRYPEIGSISFEPQHNGLTLKFMLSAIPSEMEYANTKQLLIDSIVAYHMLEGFPLQTCEIQLHNYDQVAMLSIARDVHTISKDEITLLITLLRENLNDYLLIDYSDSLVEEDLLLQEEIIEDMLANISQSPIEHRLIGIREDGRVFVFNK